MAWAGWAPWPARALLLRPQRARCRPATAQPGWPAIGGGNAVRWTRRHCKALVSGEFTAGHALVWRLGSCAGGRGGNCARPFHPSRPKRRVFGTTRVRLPGWVRAWRGWLHGAPGRWPTNRPKLARFGAERPAALRCPGALAAMTRGSDGCHMARPRCSPPALLKTLTFVGRTVCRGAEKRRVFRSWAPRDRAIHRRGSLASG